MMPERITSRQNPLLQQVKKLQTSRAYRQECGLFVGDGVKLLAEAVRWYPGLRTVIASDGVALDPLPEAVRLVTVPADVMQSISQMQSPQGVLFVCDLPVEKPLSLRGGSLILDGIQDPGNLGTILRTADALEVPVALTEGCADPYNPKTVRASMGAVFRTQPQTAGFAQIAAHCAADGIELIATALTDRARDIRDVPLQHAAVIIGSEGSGVTPDFLALAGQEIIIPMNERCESLNAAVAATIVMWQLRR